MNTTLKPPKCSWCGETLEENFSKYDDGSGYFCGYICPSCHCSTPGYISELADSARMKAWRIASLKTPYVNPYKDVLPIPQAEPTIVPTLFEGKEQDEHFIFEEHWVEMKAPHSLSKTRLCRNKDGEIMILIDNFFWRLEDVRIGNTGLEYLRNFRCWKAKPTDAQMSEVDWE